MKKREVTFHSQETKDLAIARREKGETILSISKSMNVPFSTLDAWLRKARNEKKKKSSC
jgi:transposase-like protein